MSRVVWKYELVPGENVIRVPPDWRLVAVGPWEPGSEAPAVWIEREREAEPTDLLYLQAIGTGHDVPEHARSSNCDGRSR